MDIGRVGGSSHPRGKNGARMRPPQLSIPESPHPRLEMTPVTVPSSTAASTTATTTTTAASGSGGGAEGPEAWQAASPSPSRALLPSRPEEPRQSDGDRPSQSITLSLFKQRKSATVRASPRDSTGSGPGASSGDSAIMMVRSGALGAGPQEGGVAGHYMTTPSPMDPSMGRGGLSRALPSQQQKRGPQMQTLREDAFGAVPSGSDTDSGAITAADASSGSEQAGPRVVADVLIRGETSPFLSMPPPPNMGTVEAGGGALPRFGVVSLAGGLTAAAESSDPSGVMDGEEETEERGSFKFGTRGR